MAHLKNIVHIGQCYKTFWMFLAQKWRCFLIFLKLRFIQFLNFVEIYISSTKRFTRLAPQKLTPSVTSVGTYLIVDLERISFH